MRGTDASSQPDAEVFRDWAILSLAEPCRARRLGHTFEAVAPSHCLRMAGGCSQARFLLPGGGQPLAVAGHRLTLEGTKFRPALPAFAICEAWITGAQC